MKSELEQHDVEAIAQKVMELLKPILSGHGKQDHDDRIFNKKELAEYLNVDVSWIDKKISENEIPYSKLGKYVRFKKSVIDKWIDRKTVKPFSPLKVVKNGK